MDEDFVDIDPEELVNYIFEELVDMGLVTERQYLFIVLDILFEYFEEMGMFENE